MTHEYSRYDRCPVTMARGSQLWVAVLRQSVPRASLLAVHDQVASTGQSSQDPARLLGDLAELSCVATGDPSCNVAVNRDLGEDGRRRRYNRFSSAPTRSLQGDRHALESVVGMEWNH